MSCSFEDIWASQVSSGLGQASERDERGNEKKKKRRKKEVFHEKIINNDKMFCNFRCWSLRGGGGRTMGGRRMVAIKCGTWYCRLFADLAVRLWSNSQHVVCNKWLYLFTLSMPSLNVNIAWWLSWWITLHYHDFKCHLHLKWPVVRHHHHHQRLIVRGPHITQAWDVQASVAWHGSFLLCPRTAFGSQLYKLQPFNRWLQVYPALATEVSMNSRLTFRDIAYMFLLLKELFDRRMAFLRETHPLGRGVFNDDTNLWWSTMVK